MPQRGGVLSSQRASSRVPPSNACHHKFALYFYPNPLLILFIAFLTLNPADMKQRITVRLKEAMLTEVGSEVARMSSISVPVNCSLGALRHTIQNAFRLPTALHVDIFVQKELVTPANLNQVMSHCRVAIQFNANE